MKTHGERYILRVDGSIEHVAHPMTMKEIERMIGADGLDTVNLRNERRQVMLVDDLGHRSGKPMNTEATKLYHSICRPGATWWIVGDVAVVPDADYAGDDL